jgi:hypothetical protein
MLRVSGFATDCASTKPRRPRCGLAGAPNSDIVFNFRRRNI